jgi:hypothetical protein
MTLRAVLASAAVLAAAAVVPAIADEPYDWVPTRIQVAHVQQAIAPEHLEAAPIGVRNQYWTGLNEDGRRIIFGVLVRRDLDPADHHKARRPAVNIVALDAMPGFFGFGCNAMFVRFDVDQDKLERLFCGASF